MNFGPHEISVITKALREFLQNDPKLEEAEEAKGILLKIDLFKY